MTRKFKLVPKGTAKNPVKGRLRKREAPAKKRGTRYASTNIKRLLG